MRPGMKIAKSHLAIGAGIIIVFALVALSHRIPASDAPAVAPEHDPDKKSTERVQSDHFRAVPDPPHQRRREF